MKLELDDHDKATIAADIAQEVLKAIDSARFKQDPVQETIFTVDTLSEYLLTTPKWVYNHMPELPHFKKDGLLRFRKIAIDQLFEENPSKKK